MKERQGERENFRARNRTWEAIIILGGQSERLGCPEFIGTLATGFVWNPETVQVGRTVSSGEKRFLPVVERSSEQSSKNENHYFSRN